MDTPTSVEDYFEGLPQRSRAALERLRAAIHAAAPEATDAISYGMPAFRMDGRSLVCYAAFKDHYSLFPMSTQVIESHREELQPYISGKGTIRFGMDERLPTALVKTIVRARVAELAARSRG